VPPITPSPSTKASIKKQKQSEEQQEVDEVPDDPDPTQKIITTSKIMCVRVDAKGACMHESVAQCVACPRRLCGLHARPVPGTNKVACCEGHIPQPDEPVIPDAPIPEICGMQSSLFSYPV
jgi:hypothetical protein